MFTVDTDQSSSLSLLSVNLVNLSYCITAEQWAVLAVHLGSSCASDLRHAWDKLSVICKRIWFWLIAQNFENSPILTKTYSLFSILDLWELPPSLTQLAGRFETRSAHVPNLNCLFIQNWIEMNLLRKVLPQFWYNNVCKRGVLPPVHICIKARKVSYV
jgi:hypothetical protein